MIRRKRIFKRFLRRFGAPRKRLVAGVGIVVVMGTAYMYNEPTNIDPAAYTPLLNTIAKGESGGNYNAYFGDPANSNVRFTDMTVSEVLRWQTEHVGQGNVSSAVGKYQIVQTTLDGLVSELNIDRNEKFDKALQDKLAIALLERRGAVKYVSSKLSREQFAANIAKEWAALPKATGSNPHASYYAGDGINTSNITVDEVYGALDVLKNSAKSR